MENIIRGFPSKFPYTETSKAPIEMFESSSLLFMYTHVLYFLHVLSIASFNCIAKVSYEPGWCLVHQPCWLQLLQIFIHITKSASYYSWFITDEDNSFMICLLRLNNFDRIYTKKITTHFSPSGLIFLKLLPQGGHLEATMSEGIVHKFILQADIFIQLSYHKLSLINLWLPLSIDLFWYVKLPASSTLVSPHLTICLHKPAQ